MSVWHWLIVVAILLLLFGRGRLSALMGDLGKGLGTFRREVSTDEQKRRVD
ncbi:twin-arginine translocase TatA/TatE family subunit [Mesorhizobium sp. M1066]|uniref:twin-arginine translocase TatA/TatE family subunit n=1 Tax=unclassified Mesorhizobium TaxID=325217 RepID=UPI00333D18FA